MRVPVGRIDHNEARLWQRDLFPKRCGAGATASLGVRLTVAGAIDVEPERRAPPLRVGRDLSLQESLASRCPHEPELKIIGAADAVWEVVSKTRNRIVEIDGGRPGRRDLQHQARGPS